MTAPTRGDILALIKKGPRTSTSIKALYQREDRGSISADLIAMINLGLIETQSGTVFDGPTYVITKKGEAALNDL